ncbi:MAG: hypothetical protein QOG48_1937 [Verrucomicrobiota bacterium]|jgi:hypothetical protein
MRTTVTIDNDVFEAARALATSSGKKLGEVLSLLARRGLKAQPDAAKKNRLPVFRVAPSAAVIPSDRAGEILAREEK